jgi:hypothetical protein
MRGIAVPVGAKRARSRDEYCAHATVRAGELTFSAARA